MANMEVWQQKRFRLCYSRSRGKGNFLPHSYLTGVGTVQLYIPHVKPLSFSHTALRDSSGTKRDQSGLSLEIPGQGEDFGQLASITVWCDQQCGCALLLKHIYTKVQKCKSARWWCKTGLWWHKLEIVFGLGKQNLFSICTGNKSTLSSLGFQIP